MYNNNCLMALWFVWDYPWKPVPEETSSSGFYGAGEDRGKCTDNLAGCHSIRAIM